MTKHIPHSRSRLALDGLIRFYYVHHWEAFEALFISLCDIQASVACRRFRTLCAIYMEVYFTEAYVDCV